MKKILLLILLVNCIAVFAADEISGRVFFIDDGDTIKVQSGGLRYTIRLWGIDAPEKDQEGGKDATLALVRLIKNQNVRVEKIDQDKYGRLIGKIYKGKIFINLEMVKTGNAWWYQYYAPDAKEFADAQANAQKNKIGLWGENNPINPADWRKNKNLSNL